MLEATLTVTAALCAGILVGDARVPTVRPAPLIAALVLTALVALMTFVRGPGNLWLALAVVATVVLASGVSAAAKWRRVLGDSSPRFRSLLLQEVLQPGRRPAP